MKTKSTKILKLRKLEYEKPEITLGDFSYYKDEIITNVFVNGEKANSKEISIVKALMDFEEVPLVRSRKIQKGALLSMMQLHMRNQSRTTLTVNIQALIDNIEAYEDLIFTLLYHFTINDIAKILNGFLFNPLPENKELYIEAHIARACIYILKQL